MAAPSVALLLAFVIGLLVEAFFVHLSARILRGHSRFGQAFTVALVGTLLAFLTFWVLGGMPILAYVLALLFWMAVCASVYRTGMVRALLIAVLAYLLWIATRWLIEALVAAMMKNSSA